MYISALKRGVVLCSYRCYCVSCYHTCLNFFSCYVSLQSCTNTLPLPPNYLNQPYWLAPCCWEIITTHSLPHINNILEQPAFFLDSWPLKMGLLSCPKTSVRNYHYDMQNMRLIMQKIGTCLVEAFCLGHYTCCDTCTCLPQYALKSFLLQCYIGVRIEQSVDTKSFLI